MKYKLPGILCLLFIAFAPFLSFGQTSVPPNYFVPTIFGKSPGVASLEKFGSYNVSMFTGLPDISIPLFTAQSGGLSVPITLSYHASGIKVNEVASWVGLGWSLSAGGNINRKIMGLADDQSGYGYLYGGMRQPGTYNPQVNTDMDYLEGASNGLYDTRPDIYSYSFPGHDGKFFFNGSAGGGFKPTMIPYSPVKISYGFNGESQAPYQSLTTFNLWDEHGNNYLFGDADIDITSTNVAASHAVNSITAWQLERMVSQNKRDTISFSYVNGQVYYPYADDETFMVIDQIFNTDPGNPQVCPYTYGSYTTSPTTTGVNSLVSEKLLQHIYFKNGRIDFDLDPTVRTDVNQNTSAYTYGLNDIKVYQLNTATKNYDLQKTVVFYKSYFNQGVNNASRLRLDSIQILDKTGAVAEHYNFVYNTSVSLPAYGSKAMDFWGYYNGKANNYLTPQMTISYSPSPGGGSQDLTIGSSIPNGRDCDSTYMQAFVLKSIYFPSGGHTDFTYQTNQFYNNLNQLRLAGGLRVTSIKSYDGINAVPLTKTYQYNQADSNFFLNSAFFGSSMTHRYFNMYGEFNIRMYGTEVQRTYVSNPRIDLDPFDAAAVVYSSVTEYNGTPAANTGKTDYFFSFESDVTQDASAVGGDLAVESYFYKRGHLVNKNEYKRKADGSYQIVRATANLYGAFPQTIYQDVGLKVGKLFYNEGPEGVNPLYYGTTSPDDTNSYRYMYYSIASDDSYLTSTSTYEYDDNDPTKSAVSTTSYNYDNVIHQQVTRTNHVDSRGDSVLTTIKYPADYASGNAVIDTMVNRNMQADPIEKWNSVKNITFNTKLVTEGELNVYKSAAQNAIVPDSVAKLQVSGGLSDFQPSNVSGGGLNRDSRYLAMIHFDQYDVNNNISQYTARNTTPVSVMWKYNSAIPVVKATNATVNDIFYEGFEDGNGNGFNNDAKAGHWSYNGNNNPYSKTLTGLDNGQYVLSCWQKSGDSWSLNSSTVTVSGNSITISQGNQLPYGQIDEVRFYPVGTLMTTYTYDPLVGMTSAMDPRGNISYYEYDSFNRLRTIKDQNHNILKAYCYNYKGQQTNCFVPQNDQPQYVYARIETGNVSYTYNMDYTEEWSYGDVYIRFYADANCTIPLSLPSDTDVTVVISEELDDDSGITNYPPEYNLYHVTAGSSSYYIGNQELSDQSNYTDNYGVYHSSNYSWGYDLADTSGGYIPESPYNF